MTKNTDKPVEGPIVDVGQAKWVFGAVASPLGVLLVWILGIGEDVWWPSIVAALWSILVIAAILGIVEHGPRTRIAGWLRHPRYTQIFVYVVRPRLDWLWEKLGISEDPRGLLGTFWACLTWRLYDRALLIAVAYPFLLLVGYWIITGNDARLGSAIVIQAAPFLSERAATLVVLVLTLGSLPLSRWAAAREQGFLRKVAPWLPIIAVAAAVAFVFVFVFAGVVEVAAAVAVVFVFAFVFVVAGAGAVAVAGAVASAGAGAVAVADAVAGAVAVAVAFAVVWMDERDKQLPARWTVTLALPLGWILTLSFVPWQDADDIDKAVFLFLGVLPLLNALFDTLSYGVTLTFLRRAVQGKAPWIFGIYDLAVALILFLGLGALLTAVIAGMNRLAGVPILDLGALFAGVSQSPQEYWWLYAMLFSTILPTAIHGCVSLLGLQGATPEPIRRWVAALYDDASNVEWKAAVAPLLVGTIWLFPFLLLGVLGWTVWHFGQHMLARWGQFYLDTLLNWAILIEAI